MSGELTPEEMNAMVTSGKVYKSSKEALADTNKDLATWLPTLLPTLAQLVKQNTQTDLMVMQ